jgi:hypothetical protein
MGNLLENIKEVRDTHEKFVSELRGFMTEDEVELANQIKSKLAEIDKEISIFFSGQI